MGGAGVIRFVVIPAGALARSVGRTGIQALRKSFFRRAVSFVAALFLIAAFAGCATTRTDGISGGGVKGVVSAPVEDAYVFIYEKGVSPHGPPFAMTKATGANGSFEMGLPDGEYVLVARKHKNGQPGSPLHKGDLRSGPVEITVKGGVVQKPLMLAAKTDNIKYFGPSAVSDTAISGRISDSEGNPVNGFRVQVYTYAQMSERPKYVSDATGPDGKYTVFLPKGGTYYLAARDNFGGPPKVGDFYGRFDEGTVDPSGVIVRTGQKLENIDITVHKVW